MDFLINFLTQTGPIVYITIFCLKVLEISLDTIRIVLINKGQKELGSLVGFVVIILWIFVASSVLSTLQEDLLKALFYALGYAVGIYVGIVIEKKIALGYVSMEINVRGVVGEELAKTLRDNKFGVTIMKGEGFNHTRYILKLHVNRKRVEEAMSIAYKNVPDSVVTINDIVTMEGGYMYGVRRRR